MSFLEFIELVKRNYLAVLAITIAALVASSSVFFLQKPSFHTTLLYSVGVSNGSESEKSFDATKLGDDFAKTVAGWMRSPSIGEKISGITSTEVAVSASPQAKQNFLVELDYQDGENADLVVVATNQVLVEEVAKYNENSKYKFLITKHGESSYPKSANLAKILLASGLGGTLLALAWIVLSTYFGGKVNSVREAEKLLKTKAMVIFSSPEKAEVNFLKKIAKGAILAGVDIDLKKLKETLHLDAKCLKLPSDAEKLSKNESKIIVVKLDESKVNTLRMLRALYEKDLKLVVWS